MERADPCMRDCDARLEVSPMQSARRVGGILCLSGVLAHNEFAPFIPASDGVDCNPTDQPSPPKPF